MTGAALDTGAGGEGAAWRHYKAAARLNPTSPLIWEHLAGRRARRPAGGAMRAQAYNTGEDVKK